MMTKRDEIVDKVLLLLAAAGRPLTAHELGAQLGGRSGHGKIGPPGFHAHLGREVETPTARLTRYLGPNPHVGPTSCFYYQPKEDAVRGKLGSLSKLVEVTPPSYELRKYFANGGHRTVLVATCARCQKKAEVACTGDIDFVTKKLHNMGWEVDAYKPKRCICPSCLKSGVAINTLEDAATIIIRDKTEAFDMRSADIAVTEFVTATTDLPNKQLSELTANERRSIRNLLELNFDDDRGRYIDGYSDKRIGEETGTPWELVAQLREVSYGQMKENDELINARAELTKLHETQADLATKFAKDHQALEQKVRDLNKGLLSQVGGLVAQLGQQFKDEHDLLAAQLATLEKKLKEL